MDADTQTIHDELLRVARNGCITYYSKIAPLIGLSMELPQDRDRLGEILGSISTREHNCGRPLLSAVVVLMEKNIPGDGFFTLARALGTRQGNDDTMYWLGELRRVHDYWA